MLTGLAFLTGLSTVTLSGCARAPSAPGRTGLFGKGTMNWPESSSTPMSANRRRCLLPVVNSSQLSGDDSAATGRKARPKLPYGVDPP